jgi:NRPS condensation-like uncharacterized protein
MPVTDQKWYKLDNAAKIIPSTERGADTRVFRLTCELKEEVDGDVLQSALERTIDEFPHFNCYLQRGLFWYYLEQSRTMKAQVSEDHLPALSAIYERGRKNLLYRVSYFHRKINLEMYHVLTDGAGGFVFLKELAANYLIEKYHIDASGAQEDSSSVREKATDAFDRFYTKNKKHASAMSKVMSTHTKAYQLKGELDPNLRIHMIEGCVSVKKYLDLCHRYHATLAVFTTSLVIEGIIRSMRTRDRKKPIVVTVPVNLRNYFQTGTTRNFYGVISVMYRPERYDGKLESVIGDVGQSFHDQLTEDRITETMNTYSALEHNWAVKVIPLQLKDVGISGINYLRKKEVTTSVSNVGRVTMPEEFIPYIDRFSSFMSTQTVQMCVSSFRDRLVFGFTSAYLQPVSVMNFMRRLSELGLDVELSTNDFDQ